MTVRAAAERVRDLGVAYPGAHEDFPWGEPVLKVDGKVFVFYGPTEADAALRLGVKLKHTATDALESAHASPMGYGLGRHGWVSFRFPADALPDPQQLAAWIDESYRCVAKKRRIKELDAT